MWQGMALLAGGAGEASTPAVPRGLPPARLFKFG